MRDFLEWAFEYAEENYDELIKIAGRVVRNSRDERLDDMVSYLVLHHLPNILSAWDPAKSGLDSHVRRSSKWYLWKFLYRQDRLRENENLWHEGCDSLGSYTEPFTALENTELITLLKNSLHFKEWMFLRMRFIDGLSIGEISKHTCLSRSTVTSKLKAAMTHAQEIFKVPSDVCSERSE